MFEGKNSFDKIKKMMVDRAWDDSENQIIDKIQAESQFHEFSAEHNEKMERFFEEFDAKCSKPAKKSIVMYKFVACILGFIIVCSSITIASVEAFRESFLNFIFESEQPNTDFGSVDNKGFFYSDDYIILKYVPSGFEMKECEVNTVQGVWIFNSDEHFLQILVTESTAGMSVDTENGSFEKVVVQDFDGIYTSNNNVNSVIFDTKGKNIMVIGDIDKLELIKIANGLNCNLNLSN